MGPSQICGCPFREPRVFEIAHIPMNMEMEFLQNFEEQTTKSNDIPILLTEWASALVPPTLFLGGPVSYDCGI